LCNLQRRDCVLTDRPTVAGLVDSVVVRERRFAGLFAVQHPNAAESPWFRPSSRAERPFVGHVVQGLNSPCR
jgi:hypothetical protein